MGRCSVWDLLLGFSRYFKSLIDTSRFFRFLIDICGYFRFLADVIKYLILVKFSKNLNRFLKFWFRIKIVYYRVFLFIIKGSKQKLKVILINNYFI